MNELIFLVEESTDGGFTAKALGHSIFTESETFEGLKPAITEAVFCHFEDKLPKIVRLHYVREEVFAVGA